MLTILDSLPEKILNLPAERLFEELSGPTLIHLQGRRKEPLFVSVLLHGNEQTGWLAFRRLMERYNGKELPRAISVFIGNVEAARYKSRLLKGQPDFNRIWKEDGSPEWRMATAVMDEMERRRVLAVVDVHNNTGINPHYACVTRLDSRTLGLAAMFDRRVVYFTKPDTTLTKAFSRICPAMTIECGSSGQESGIDNAVDFIDGCLHMSDLPESGVKESDIELYHSVAIIKPAEGASISFGEGDVDIQFRHDLDHLNFRLLPAGTRIAKVRNADNALLRAIDEDGGDVWQKYFKKREGWITLSREVMPSMLTLNVEIIRQDCLCYFMEKLNYPDVLMD